MTPEFQGLAVGKQSSILALAMDQHRDPQHMYQGLDWGEAHVEYHDEAFNPKPLDSQANVATAYVSRPSAAVVWPQYPQRLRNSLTAPTELAFNSHYGEYECYICHDLFPYLSSLNQHLDSPRHQRDLYHCPNRSCLREFTTLAGLINHLESESCRFMRFQAVQNGIRGLFSSQRSVSFR